MSGFEKIDRAFYSLRRYDRTPSGMRQSIHLNFSFTGSFLLSLGSGISNFWAI